MLIAILSDSHNNQTNLAKVLAYCKKENIKTIIHCGDLASFETLDFLNDNFSGRIHFTFGNMDVDQMKSHFNVRTSTHQSIQAYKHVMIYFDFGALEIDKHKIAFVHYPKKAKELAKTGKYSHVFYGHTHKPWVENIGNAIVLNPGNAAGELYLPTFAVWDTNKNDFSLIRVHDLK